MTTTDLPRRPYVEQQPPLDGLQNVQTVARGRRRRRSLLVATGCSAVVAVSAVVVLVSTSSGEDSLRPLPPASNPTPSSSPAPVAEHTSSVRAAGAGAAGGVTTAGRHHTGGSDGVSSVTDPTDPRAAGSAATDTSNAPAVKLHVFRSSPAGSGAQICAGDVSSGAGSLGGGGVGWCEFATAEKVAGGVQLTFSACRDDTTGGKLTYSTTREVDIAVKRGGRTIWDWAADHPGTQSAHSRQAAANSCWNWQLVWPDITQSGSSAGHGQFTFVGTPTAQELAGYPPETIPFRY